MNFKSKNVVLVFIARDDLSEMNILFVGKVSAGSSVQITTDSDQNQAVHKNECYIKQKEPKPPVRPFLLGNIHDS